MPEPTRNESAVDRKALRLGVGFYALAALADIYWTSAGLGGNIALEGNALMRGLMAKVGIAEGMCLGKAAVGLACFAIAGYGAPEIRRKAAWIDKVPSTRWARAWMKSGDRSWIAYLPLYGTALFQLFAAGSWVYLLRR